MKYVNTISIGLLVAILLTAGNAFAVVPDLIPLQGMLQDDEGDPLDESAILTFRMYDDEVAATAFWTEEQSVQVEDGYFSVYLGDTMELPSDYATHASVWLGISVNDDPEMERFELAAVPYALEAQLCHQIGDLTEEAIAEHRHDDRYAPASSGVPSGAVMFFSAEACPTGWQPFTEGQGRVMLGAAPGDGEESVGVPLPPGGLRTITEVPSHGHSVDPGVQSVTVEEESEHTHTVDPASFETLSNDGVHTHDTYMSLAGEHSHTWRIENINGFGDYAIAGSENNSGGMTFTPPSAGSHRHSLTVYESSHTHQINVPPTTTHVTTPHTHAASFDMPAFQTSQTGAAAVDVTMPYIQLLICIKE
jgi:hypothetical protein